MVNRSSVRPASSDEWDRIWASARYATYFHSREWAEVWERTSGSTLRPAPLLVQFPSGATALLPLVVRVRCGGLVKSYLSSVAGTYGGWLAAKPLSDADARALAEFMVRQLPVWPRIRCRTGRRMGYPGRSLDKEWWSCLPLGNEMLTGVMILLVWGRDKPTRPCHGGAGPQGR